MTMPASSTPAYREFLHRVVDRQIVVRELAAQSGEEVVHDFTRTDRKQLAAEAAGRDAEADIDSAVDHQEPHGGEMPQQRAGQPIAERNLARER